SILSLATALPAHRMAAQAGADLLASVWPRLRAGTRGGGLGSARFTVEPAARLLEERSLGQSMEAYTRHALSLGEEAASLALGRAGLAGGDVDLVISVSCTGYLVPSLEARLAGRLGLRPDVIRLPITELGCSGGSAGIAFAHRHLAGWPRHRVLVLAVEVPSLNFQPGDTSLDNMAASLVFGDGAAAAVMTGGRGEGLSVESVASHLVPDSLAVLGYDLRDDGFHVVLDRALARLVRDSLGPVVDGFRKSAGIERVDFLAAHGGGPRILEAVEGALGLDPCALAVSRQLFTRIGNVSSASILFALEAMAASLGEEPAEGLGLGFGPGLSIELAHLRWAGGRAR
ncbi:MAG: type III polyketide synthase, partial [Candidatus Dormibacteraceae bacterium]